MALLNPDEIFRGSILLPDEAHENLVIKHGKGIEDSSRDRRKFWIGADPPPAGQGRGIAGTAFNLRKTVLITDVERCDLYLHLPDREHIPYKSILCVPLRIGPEVYGVLSIDGLRKGSFEDEVDEAIVDLVGSLLVLVVRHDRVNH